MMSYNMKSKSWAHTCIVAFLPLVVKQMLNDVLFLLQIDHKTIISLNQNILTSVKKTILYLIFQTLFKCFILTGPNIME